MRKMGTPTVLRKVAFPPARSARLRAGLCLGAILWMQACKSEAPKPAILAQVGSSTLTLDDLRESFPLEFEQLIRKEQYLDFVNRWVDDEAVFQRALQSRLEQDPRVRRKLDKLRRKLLIEEFLARENPPEAFQPDEMAMNQYYEMHKDEFRRKAPEIKYAAIRLPSDSLARAVRAKSAGDNFLQLAAANSLDPVPESYASIPFRPEPSLPPCLAAEAAALKAGAVSKPITCPDGAYLIKVLEKAEAGGFIPFQEAREQIAGTLMMEKKDKMREDKIAKYKEGASIALNLDLIPGLAEAPADAAPSPPAEPAAPPTAGPDSTQENKTNAP